MRLILIPSGSFRMGWKGFSDAEPIHRVTLSAFWMGENEVTNAEFEQFKKRPRPPESLGDSQPVTRVTFEEASAFCAWLSRKEKRHYRLPTEAEWEYAARGGLDQKLYPWGDDEDWTGRARFGELTTSPVGSYPPNGFGLHDMAGNVAEWVSDWYDEHYYAHSPAKDPKGPPPPPASTHPDRILRGGFCSLWEGPCGRRMLAPGDGSLKPQLSKFHDIDQADGSGFRVVCEEPSTMP